MHLREKCGPDRSIDTARLTMSLVYFVLSSSRFWSNRLEFCSSCVCLSLSRWWAKLRQGVSNCLRETRSIDTSLMSTELHRYHCICWSESLSHQRLNIHSTGETESIQRWSRSSARSRTNSSWCRRRRRRRMTLIVQMRVFSSSETIFQWFVQCIVDLSPSVEMTNLRYGVDSEDVRWLIGPSSVKLISCDLHIRMSVDDGWLNCLR